MPDQVTTIDSSVRRPIIDVAELLAYRSVLGALVKRELTIRYKQALIGFAWIVIQPAVSTVVYTLLFGVIARFPSSNTPYPVFVLVGVVFWSYFAKVLSDGTQCLISNRPMITKVYFPRLIIPLSHAIEALVDFVVVLVILFLFMLTLGQVPGRQAFFLPLFVLVAMMFSFGLACLFGALNVMYRDMKFLVVFGLQIGFFATPVVYPVGFLPANWTWVLSLNPLTLVIEGARWSLLGAGSPPALGDTLVSLAVTFATLAVGVWYFRRAEGRFADSI
ncbi:MAG: ABC transporter permease [Alphaproteobacteria bacterium]|nr:ABC transporter permease [Alphaproteobacteria bacterium]